MTKTPLHKNEAGQPSANGGHFAATTKTEAPEGLLAVSASSRFALAREAEEAAHRAVVDLAPDTIRELILAASPAAATARFEFTEDEDTPAFFSLRRVEDARGNEIIVDSNVHSAVTSVGRAFQSSDEVMENPAFRGYTPRFQGTFWVHMSLATTAGE
jgi:hypothetical protein